MSDHEQGPSPKYPENFDPERFANPEHCLVASRQPGFIGIGEEVEIDGEIDMQLISEKLKPLTEEMQTAGINVGIMVMERVDGSFSYFPVYLEGELEIPPERINQARGIVENNEAFAQLSPQQKSQEIITLAAILAQHPEGTEVHRIDEKGDHLVHYPQQDE